MEICGRHPTEQFLGASPKWVGIQIWQLFLKVAKSGYPTLFFAQNVTSTHSVWRRTNFYAISGSYHNVDDDYDVKFWDRDGTNPTYEANIYFSKVRDSRFINVLYWENPNLTNQGSIFPKILDINSGFTKLTIAVVAGYHYATTKKQT